MPQRRQIRHQIRTHQFREQMHCDAGQRVGPVPCRLLRLVRPQDFRQQRVADPPQVQAGNQNSVSAIHPQARIVDRLHVAAMPIDHDQSRQLVAQQACQHVANHRTQRGLLQRDPTRHRPEIIGATEWQNRRHHRFMSALRRTRRDQLRNPRCRKIITHRGVRPLILVTAHRQENHRITRIDLPRFAPGQFRHPHFARHPDPLHPMDGNGTACIGCPQPQPASGMPCAFPAAPSFSEPQRFPPLHATRTRSPAPSASACPPGHPTCSLGFQRVRPRRPSSSASIAACSPSDRTGHCAESLLNPGRPRVRPPGFFTCATRRSTVAHPSPPPM